MPVRSSTIGILVSHTQRLCVPASGEAPAAGICEPRHGEQGSHDGKGCTGALPRCSQTRLAHGADRTDQSFWAISAAQQALALRSVTCYRGTSFPQTPQNRAAALMALPHAEQTRGA